MYPQYAGDTDVCRSDQTISRGSTKENKDTAYVTWPPHEARCAWEPKPPYPMEALQSRVAAQY